MKNYPACKELKHALALDTYSKTCVKRSLSKRRKLGFQYQLSPNAGQKYCRMLQGEHSAILLTFIKQPCVIKNFVLFIFGWPFYTGFTICLKHASAAIAVGLDVNLSVRAFIYFHIFCMQAADVKAGLSICGLSM